MITTSIVKERGLTLKCHVYTMALTASKQDVCGPPLALPSETRLKAEFKERGRYNK